MSRLRIYKKSESILFRKTTEKWGGLSNMARGYPLQINNIDIQSSEILYQSLRFSNFPEIQREIILETNPMYAKRLARKYISYTRDNWDKNRISIMKWCIAVKLCQNWETFSKLLLNTYPNYIIEYSEKDVFWGARYQDLNKDYLIGENVLGRILMQMRDLVNENDVSLFEKIYPLKIDNFSLLGEPIPIVSNTFQEGNFQNSFHF